MNGRKENEKKEKADWDGEDGVEKGGFSSRSRSRLRHGSPVSHVIVSVKGVHSSYKML